MKFYLLALVFGIIFPLGFAPFNIWPLTIFSLSGLLYLLNKEDLNRPFLTCLLYGLGLWGLGVSWIYVSIHYHGNLSFISSILITFVFIFFLSLYIGLSGLLYRKLKTNQKILNYLIFFPVIWVSIELFRSHFLTGFPWLIIGTSLAGTSVGGWIPIFGSYGGSFVILILSGCLLLIYENRTRIYLLPPLIILIILFSSFTLNKINWTTEIEKVYVSIYQPNLTLKEKWSSQGIQLTRNLIQESISTAKDNEFIFFPETALIQEKDELEPWISMIEKEAYKRDISLITGIFAKDPNESYLIERYNRIQGFGSIQGHYDKVHLVPFGEYIPFRKYIAEILDFMDINLVNTLSGGSFTSLIKGKIKISPSICYEIAFTDLVRKTAKTSNLLVNISNDTWFGTSIGPEQHLEIAQSRALEHQKGLIRITNSGISAIITRKGRILERQGYFEEKQLKREVEVYEGRTPFSIIGNLVIYFCIMIGYLYLLYIKRTKVLNKFNEIFK